MNTKTSRHQTKTIAILDTRRSRRAINRALQNANGDAADRTLTYYSLADGIEEATQRLAHLPTSLWEGVVVTIDPWDVPDSAPAYVKSTKATIAYERGEWRLVGVERGPARRTASWLVSTLSSVRVTLPADTDRAALLDEFLSLVGLSVAESQS